MGKISRDEFRKLARAAADLQQLPLYIDDTPALSIAALRTRARRLKRQRGIGLIVVDYLQRLQGSRGSEEQTSEPQALMRISYAVLRMTNKKESKGKDNLPN